MLKKYFKIEVQLGVLRASLCYHLSITGQHRGGSVSHFVHLCNNSKTKHRFFRRQKHQLEVIFAMTSLMYIFLFLLWCLLMSVLQLFHLCTSTFDLTCLIRWCFLKSIMGFFLLISSSLNAASLR